jgi:hypothetical protein
MALAIGDACAGRHLSLSEGFGLPSGEFTDPIIHRKPLPFGVGVLAM